MIYNIHQVIKLTTLSKSTLYRLIRENKFPRPVKLSERRTGWRPADILAFTQNGLAK